MFDWTEARIDELKQDVSDGLSAGNIAKKYGVSRNTVCGKIHRLKLAPSRQPFTPKLWFDESEDQLRTMWAEGKTSRTIAAELGYTQASVLKKARRLNLEKRENTGGRGKARAKRPMQPRLSPFQRILAGMNTPRPCAQTHDAVPAGHPVAFMDLEPQHCRFPVADPIMFCGNDRGNGVPYCYGHCRIAYNKPPSRTERAYIPPRGQRAA